MNTRDELIQGVPRLPAESNGLRLEDENDK